MPAGRGGAALIYVLGLLVILGVIAAEIGRAVRLEASVLTALRARTVARYAAESGVVAAVSRIEGLLDSAPTPPERAAGFHDLRERLAPLQDVTLGGARFGVGVVDLNARIDLNHAEAGTLKEFFRQFAGERQAAVIVTALKTKPVARISELREVPGIDETIALAVAPYVTVWGDGKVNINSAPESVLAALPGVGEVRARSVIERREAGEVFTAPGALQPSGTPGVEGPIAPERLFSTAPTRLMIVARGWQEGFPLTHEIQAAYSVIGVVLILQAWQERDL
jgi:general secretion pathway protein K